MIISVTPNTAVDYTLRVSEFTLGQTIRSLESAWGMGGKAADAAWILGHYGVTNLALGFAAGQNGHRMEGMLHERGCQTDFVWVNGETRLNIVLSKNGNHSTFTTSTLEVTSNHIYTFFAKYAQALERASCLIFGGSLPKGVPPSFIADVIKMARTKDIPILFDSSGPYLKMGIDAHPTVVKPNLVELQELTSDRSIAMSEDSYTEKRMQMIYTCAQKLSMDYDVSVVVTMGKEGALALLGNSHYWIPSLKVEVVSAAGAGDGVLAGLAMAFSERKPITDGLRLGFALASAITLTTATADYHINDVQRFLPLIELIPITSETFTMPGTLKRLRTDV